MKALLLIATILISGCSLKVWTLDLTIPTSAKQVTGVGMSIVEYDPACDGFRWYGLKFGNHVNHSVCP